jgi:hypothetical protein
MGEYMLSRSRAVPRLLNHLSTVMPALVAGTHVLRHLSKQDVDGRDEPRDEPGHDSE